MQPDDENTGDDGENVIAKKHSQYVWKWRRKSKCNASSVGDVSAEAMIPAL